MRARTHSLRVRTFEEEEEAFAFATSVWLMRICMVRFICELTSTDFFFEGFDFVVV